MLKSSEIHNKIIDILRSKGPSLPINISKELSMNSLFISAFLSELSAAKRIRVSNMKIGGSPLYYLEGQEEKLETFYKFLHPKEAEAFLFLKKKKILKDSDQDPAIRVALRSLRDFAIGFKKDEEIYWRYYLTKESIPLTKIKQKPREKTKEIEIINPLVISEKKPKKEKSKSEFVEKIISFLTKNFKIIEEKEYKKNEYNCIVQIKSELGPINLLAQAKDKKTVSETDLKKLLSSSQKIPLLAFLIYTGELSKKAQEFADKYFSILKTKKIIKQ